MAKGQLRSNKEKKKPKQEKVKVPAQTGGFVGTQAKVPPAGSGKK
jgi:hypothetical protein